MIYSIINVFYRALHVMVSVGCLAVGTVAFAQTAPFPSRPVTIVVPNAPGGAIDILARLLEKNLSDKWKQPVLVVYKAGQMGPGCESLRGQGGLRKGLACRCISNR